jgi:hypothetical protein
MLMATHDPVRFATSVGVAPSTTTMTLGAAQRAAQNTPVGKPVKRRYYVPYASIEDLKAAYGGLGIINEGDAWLTGRPYGLPGTATVRLSQQPGGYDNSQGYHYDASMVGGGFGDADTQNIALQVQKVAEAQALQAKAMERQAFWSAIQGGIFLGTFVLGAAVGITSYMRSRQRSRGGW